MRNGEDLAQTAISRFIILSYLCINHLIILDNPMSIIKNDHIRFGMKQIGNSSVQFMQSDYFFPDSVIADFVSIIGCDNLLEAINRRSDKFQRVEIIYTTRSLQHIIISCFSTTTYHDAEKYNVNPAVAPDFTLPTSDFREIVMAWRNFIST